MPPRLSARRLCLIIAFLAGTTTLVSLHQKFTWTTSSSSTSPQLKQQKDDDDEQSPPASAYIQMAMEQNIATSIPYISNKKEEVDKVDEEEVVVETSEGVEKNHHQKPWFFDGGTLYPTASKEPLKLFPEQADGDRIIEQLMYVPENYQGYDSEEKLILAYNGLGTWGQKTGPGSFFGCPVSRCSLTDDRSKAQEADAILYKDHFIHPNIARLSKQIWIMYFLECPYHTQSIKFSNLINWTATYRTDSDLVAPYERWTYYNPQVKQKIQNHDYSANKTKKVAWFVSNCGARNGRLAYARELGKYISVDIYGTCGPLKCPRSDKKCFELLERDYKFYLAFENSNCRDYITEKFYVNGLGQNVLPIVMGARPEDYERNAPEKSYIHVDEFDNPAELAAYLHRLDKDNNLYNSYFKWKGTGEFINTYFWCRLCALLHAQPPIYKHYLDVNDWWRGPGICSTKSWRNNDFS